MTISSLYVLKINWTGKNLPSPSLQNFNRMTKLEKENLVRSQILLVAVKKTFCHNRFYLNR